MRLVERLARRLREMPQPERAEEVTGDDERSLGRGGTRGQSGADRLPQDEVATEDDLRRRLNENPNDQQVFDKLVALIRRRAIDDAKRTEAANYSHDTPGLTAALDIDVRQIGRDSVWALAEELAGNQKAWYPLIELARLSVREDREGALRRLGIAAERDPRGEALAAGLKMLRQESMPGEALSLGTGHWRPKEHSLVVGREMVEAALASERYSEAQRFLDMLGESPDTEGADALRRQLEPKFPTRRD